MKKLLSVIAVMIILSSAIGINAEYVDWQAKYPWAIDGVEYCINNKILEGYEGDLMLDMKLTRAQAAKIAAVAFNLQDTGSNSFSDVTADMWEYPYVNAIESYMVQKDNNFSGRDYITREDFTVLLSVIKGYSAEYTNSLYGVFSDASKINYSYRGYIRNAYDAGIVNGSNGNFRPKAFLTRAEACTMILRAINAKAIATPEPTVTPTATPTATSVPTATPVPTVTVTSNDETAAATPTPTPVRETTYTGPKNIVGESLITVEQAQAWAKSKGATEKFINIAPTYWYYGELSGIRPEVLYAQAALETGYGKYTGVVTEDMNNWAGIKVYGRNDDAKDAHESFETPEDGARAHFNHMSAYVGVEPIGEPHARYYSVKSLDWAGTVKEIPDLSGKWCPDLNYANKIMENCLEPMENF